MESVRPFFFSMAHRSLPPPFFTEVYQSTYRALQLGIRSFFLKEMKILELQEAILPAVLGNLVGKLFV